MARIKDKFLAMRWWQQVMIVAVCAIAYIQITGLLGAKVFPPLIGWRSDGIPRLNDASPGDFPALFVRWDAGYYLGIVENGYAPKGDERAFFPLYPMLVRAINDSLGIPVLWAGWLLSILSFIGTGLFMYQWVRIDYSHERALSTTALMYIFPMAFFFIAFYGEPLLLLTSVACMYFARRGQFVASGMAIALAGAARGTAFLLAIPYIIEFWQQRDFSRAKWTQFALGILIAPTGMLAYLAFLARQSNMSLFDAYASVGAVKWQTYYAWPWDVLMSGVSAAVFGTGITSDWFSRTLAWHDLAYAVLGLGIAIWALRHMRLSHAAFLLVGMLFLYTVHGPYGYAFWSISRRVAVLVPVYLAITLVMDRWPARYRAIAVGVSILLLGILSAWFVSGRWVA